MPTRSEHGTAPEHDLFVSYVEADRAWVEGYLLDALEAAGLRVHSEQAFRLGVPRLLEFERAVQQSQRTLLVLSPAYLAEGFGQFTDLLAQSYGLETATWPVIPLILHPVQLPPRLAMLTALDASDPDTWPQVLERLLADLQRPPPPPPVRPPCPYPGMVPFGEADSDRFFGRDREIQELLQRLRLHPFITVIGPSGSGKSSLVFAGLIPALRRSTLFGPGVWSVKSMRPGESPLSTLQTVLGNTLNPGRSPLLAADCQIRRRTAGSGDPAGADCDVLNLQPSDQPPATGDMRLLIVDQFEELFTLAGEEALPFQEALLRLMQVPNTFLVLTVRADFYPDLMTSPLWPQIQAHRLEVLPLDEEGLRQAIVRPAEDVGVFVETALVERLLADAAHEPGILPLMQETLVLLWEKVERRFLPLRAYQALTLPRRAYGAPPLTGLQVAMARRADAALAALTPGQQAIARRIFLRLVQFGEGRADTRRQQPAAALRAAGDVPDEFERTLEHLVRHRLLTLSGEATADERRTKDERFSSFVPRPWSSLVDIAHEALITGWPTLQEWLSERREAEQTRRRLEAKAAEWLRLGRGTGGLLDEVELLEAERWLASPDAADLGTGETLPALVQASRAAIAAAEREKEAARQRELALERKARRRLQGLALVLGMLAFIAAAFLARLEILRQSARLAGQLRPLPGLNVAFERYEVTNARYARCVQAGRCIEPPPQLSTFHREDSADRPVTGVDALQAAAFCRWIGRRLPTLAEWEVAAHQTAALPWPLSEASPYDFANLAPEGPVDQNLLPEPVGSRQPTPEGIYDLVGNVEEWTSTPWGEAGPERSTTWNMTPADVPQDLTTVGGSYQATLSGFDPVNAHSAFRYETIGFRCVR
ncbi:MAG: SUMF1/EgtB/PvdO family nonheme iron enzyme [Anaerolineae bacterium]|nr:SUMF1/EgtB/PvdO family nonheme iron enzyme [Anaerolineae bacterium]